MPSPHTFTIKPIAELLRRVLTGRSCIVDPFAGRSTLARHSNDLGRGGVEAPAFVRPLASAGIKADAILLDPPYSPRQMSEVYKGVGLSKGMKSSQTAALYAECKDELTKIAAPGCVAVTFGWSSVGFGKGRGWALDEVLIVCHGGAHNDTICTVETRNP